ncbi:hypothetical protein ACLMJK_000584 [Lecanora helva]
MAFEVLLDKDSLRKLTKQIRALDQRLENLYTIAQEQILKPGKDKDKDYISLTTLDRMIKETTEKRQIKRRERRERRHHMKTSCPWSRLSIDLQLHVMRYTDITAVDRVVESKMVDRATFEQHENAIYRGMEVEQFSELKWLIGDSKRRSPEQKQWFKDLIASTFRLRDPAAALHASRRIDSDAFDDRHNIELLQDIQDGVSRGARVLETSRRTTLCLIALCSLRISFCEVEEKSLDHIDNIQGRSSPLVIPRSIKKIPLESRCALFDAQAPCIKTEIRITLQNVVLEVMMYLENLQRMAGARSCFLMGHETAVWIQTYFSPEKVDQKMELASMGSWIAKLATGYILGYILEYLGDMEYNEIADIIRADVFIFGDALDDELENSGSTDKYWRYEQDFANHIGFDWSIILKDTPVESCLEYMLAEDATGENQS